MYEISHLFVELKKTSVRHVSRIKPLETSKISKLIYRFVIYDGIRILQMIVEIIENGLASHIIKNLKVRTNAHILMTFVAVSCDL